MLRSYSIKKQGRRYRIAGVLFLSAVLTVALGGGSALAQEPVAAPRADGAGFAALPGGQDQPGAEELAAGRNAAMRGRWQEALDHFRAALDRFPDGQLADYATYWSARSLQALGRYAEAVEWAALVINDYPRSELRRDARAVQIDSAAVLVRQGNPDYERYLVDAVAPPAPPAGSAPHAADAPPQVDAPDAESELRILALEAMINMDPEDAWPILQRLMTESTDPKLRQRGIWLLSEVGTDEAFQMLADMARTDANPEVRSQALFWVSQSDAHAELALDLLIDLAASADDESANAAIFGLSQIEDERSRQALEGIARDSSRSAEIRGQALFWLADQAGADSLALLGEVALNDPDMELRSQAMFGISQIDSPEASDFLLQVARSDDAPMELRSNAIFWLGERKDGRAVDILLSLWNETDDLEIRNQLLFALSQSDSEQAVDHIIAVAKDPAADAEMRKQAVFWLGQSEHPKAKQALLDIIGGQNPAAAG